MRGITASVFLELYQVKSTCYFNIDMPYCPVLVRVADDLLEINGRFRYLLQVWNDENVKVFERQLNCKSAALNNSINHSHAVSNLRIFL